jgi:cytochrome c-type biogenesis protein CcmE
MSHKAARIGITGLVLVLAFTGLMYTTLSEGTEYYKHVDEVMANPAEWQGKRLQVHGFAKDVRRTRDAYKYRFELHNNGAVIHASYEGIAPDTFINDAEVVMKGTLQPDGTFLVEKDGIMAKCPSKYEPQAVTPASTSTTGSY